jgi:hypothetical protein
METIEKRVAGAILQEPSGKLTINGQTYEVAPPSIATLISVSSLVQELPKTDRDAGVLSEVLRTAKDSKVIGEIAATLILGAKRIRERRMVRVRIPAKRKWNWRRLSFTDQTQKETTELQCLSETILDEVPPKELSELIGKRLIDMQVGDFFALTTSLSEIRMTKSTREVDPTAHGDSSTGSARTSE